MKRKTIVSSNINSIGYDEKTQTLQVEFYNQKVFNYAPVGIDTYQELMAAESIGSYFAKNIRANSNLICTQVS